MRCALEGQSGVAVRCEDFLNRVDVRGGSQVQAEVESGSGLHDGASWKDKIFLLEAARFEVCVRSLPDRSMV